MLRKGHLRRCGILPNVQLLFGKLLPQPPTIYNLCVPLQRGSWFWSLTRLRKMLEAFQQEDLVTKGTSSFNFKEDAWANAPTFEPAKCTGCKRVIKTACEPHSMIPGGYQCMNCVGVDFKA